MKRILLIKHMPSFLVLHLEDKRSLIVVYL